MIQPAAVRVWKCWPDFGGQFKAHLLDRRGALELLDAALGIKWGGISRVERKEPMR